MGYGNDSIASTGRDRIEIANLSLQSGDLGLEFLHRVEGPFEAGHPALECFAIAGELIPLLMEASGTSSLICCCGGRLTQDTSSDTRHR